jgi:ATP-dependent DNA helicase RecG
MQNALFDPDLKVAMTRLIRRIPLWQVFPTGARLKIQRIPLTIARISWRGRPRGSVFCGSWSSGSISFHCLSVRSIPPFYRHRFFETTSIESLESEPVLAIRMTSAASPVALRGRYYRRIGNTSREVPDVELPRFLLERTGQTWDALPGDFEISDLAPKVVENFKVLAQERLPQLAPSDDLDTLLRKLRLVTADNRLKRAALLLFGQDPQELAPSAQIQVGRFRDDETILDDKRVEGNLFHQLDTTTQILRNYFFVRFEIPSTARERMTSMGSLQRQEIWEYPLSAVREAILNALIHRDYTSTGRIQIRVYDDRMVITNPGGLPEGITVSDLLREPHGSLPRNPILAQVCY